MIDRRFSAIVTVSLLVFWVLVGSLLAPASLSAVGNESADIQSGSCLPSAQEAFPDPAFQPLDPALYGWMVGNGREHRYPEPTAIVRGPEDTAAELIRCEAALRAAKLGTTTRGPVERSDSNTKVDARHDYAKRLAYIGQLHRRLGNVQQARRAWESALNRLHSEGRTTWSASLEYQIGSILHGERQYGAALLHFEAATQQYQALSRDRSVAILLYNQAVSHYEGVLRRWDGSSATRLVELLEESERVASRSGHEDILLRVLWLKGWAQLDNGNLIGAEEAFSRGIRVAQHAGDEWEEMSLIASRGWLKAHTDRYDSALADLERSRTRMKRLGNQWDLPIVLRHLCAISDHVGQLTAGLEFCRLGLPHALETENYDVAVLILRRMAGIERRMGQYDPAAKHLEDALDLARTKLNSKADIGLLFSLMGKLQRRRGDSIAAVRLQRQALQVLRGGVDGWSEAGAWYELGLNYQDLKRWHESERCLKTALSLHRIVGNQKGEVETLVGLSELSIRFGDPDKADGFLDRAQQRVVLSKDEILRAKVFQGRGDLALARDAPSVALDYYRKAEIALQNSEAFYKHAFLTWRIARAYHSGGETIAAIDAYKKALELFSRLRAQRDLWQCHAELAMIFYQAGQREQASAHLDMAKAELLSTPKSQIVNETSSSFFATTTDIHVLAIHLLADKRKQASREQEKAIVAETFRLAEEARAHTYSQRLSQAGLSAFSEAPVALRVKYREIFQDLKRLQVFQLRDHMDDIERGILTRYLHEKIETIAYTMRSKPEKELPAIGRVYLDRQAAIDGAYLAPDDRRRLLQDAIREYEARLEDVEAEIAQSSSRYRSTAKTPMGLRALQDSLAADTAVLAYLLYSERSYLWVATSDSAEMIILPGRERIVTALDRLMPLLRRPDSFLFDLKTESYRLYEMLVEPAQNLIRDRETLVILPDASIAGLPFEALVTARPSDAASQAAFLALDHIVVYALSADSWQENLNQGAGEMWSKPLLALTNPSPLNPPCRLAGQAEPDAAIVQRTVLDDGVCQPLPGAYEEVRRIRRMRQRRWRIPGSDSGDLYLMGQEVSEETFREIDLTKYSMLHFSTHARVDPSVPARSYLLLGARNNATFNGIPSELEPVDGRLDLREVGRLKLSADLVFLSACDTAAGRAMRGEGVESLARGFLLAGAKNVVASQWRIDDAFSAAFVIRFYELAGKWPMARALAMTKQELLRWEGADRRKWNLRRSDSFRHPYFWAPFVLVSGGSGVRRTAGRTWGGADVGG